MIEQFTAMTRVGGEVITLVENAHEWEKAEEHVLPVMWNLLLADEHVLLVMWNLLLYILL